MDAKKSIEKSVGNIRVLLKDIEVKVDRYEALAVPNHGHAGDLHYLEHLLEEAYEFIKG